MTLRQLKEIRNQAVVFIIDFLISLLIIYFAHLLLSGQFPRWYWLLLSCALWSGLGLATRKLSFSRYRRVRHALVSIIVMDAFVYAVLLLCWSFAAPDKELTTNLLLPLPILILSEILFYFIYRSLVLRKMPFFYEELITSEKYDPSIKDATTIEQHPNAKHPDLLLLREKAHDRTWSQLYRWIIHHRDVFSDKTILVESNNPEEVFMNPLRDPDYILFLQPFNDFRHINTMLSFANYKLVDGGILSIHGITSGQRRQMIINGNPPLVNYVILFFDYIWSRVLPKLHGFRSLYMCLSRAVNRNIPRVEILGRICRSGFSIVNEEIVGGEYYISAVKVSKPIRTDNPSYGPLVRLRRVGHNGSIIGVYKFRTMYAYSEYLQAYAYQQVGLQDGGKLSHDFRVNKWGRFLRSVWLDEFPMLLNWIKGDLKLVGVRPLSQHYFSLYTPEMQRLRIQVQPGLIPPFYYERHQPKTIEDVQDSERRYIESYLRSPFLTDLRYLTGSLVNIIFHHSRSH